MDREICLDCGGRRVHNQCYLTCTKCGLQEEIHFVPEYDKNAWMKKKTVHKRDRWFRKKLEGVIDLQLSGILTEDFMQVVNQLKENKLIKKMLVCTTTILLD